MICFERLFVQLRAGIETENLYQTWLRLKGEMINLWSLLHVGSTSRQKNQGFFTSLFQYYDGRTSEVRENPKQSANKIFAFLECEAS